MVLPMSISVFFWLVAVMVTMAVVWSASVWSRKRRDRELREHLGFPEFTIQDDILTPPGADIQSAARFSPQAADQRQGVRRA